MPPYDALNFDSWCGKTRDSAVPVAIDCLMPNGLCITLKVQSDTTLAECKAQLWKEAKKSPLYHLLKEAKFYVFSCVDRKGSLEELVDEKRTVFDVQPFKPYFKVVEKQGDEAEKLVNSKISMLIGKSLTEFDNMDKIEEVHDFRRKYKSVCESVSTSRRRAVWDDRAMYAYPPQFADSMDFPEYLRPKMNSSEFIVYVTVAKSITHTFHIPYEYKVSELVQVALEKKASTLALREPERADEFILKIAGKTSFLFGWRGENEEPRLLHFKVSL